MYIIRRSYDHKDNMDILKMHETFLSSFKRAVSTFIEIMIAPTNIQGSLLSASCNFKN